jgi:iron complex outermembrane receptor protein
VGIYDRAPLSRYSHYVTASWEKGAWNAQIANRLSSGYIDYNDGNGRDKTYEFYNEVKDYSLWDLSASYKRGETWTVTALIRNLFNTDPPFTNKVSGVATGYDERYADPTGRAFGLTISARLKRL